ncbi:MAG: RecX family transcriptional regulator [Candidatus Dojkabacteria bacterium]|nr:MAG: RecX family transcriptional regulator [Candidatus Dojkabacteria bacterium]
MKITDLKIQKRNQNRFNMFVDGEFVVGVSANIVAKYGIYKERDIETEELALISEAAIFERFWNRTVKYLESRLRSEYQVRQYIRKLYHQKRDDWIGKNVDFDLGKMEERIIEELLRFKIIDDRAYAEAFIRDRTKMRPRGKILLVQELRSKGIDRKLANEVVNELIVDEGTLIADTLYKKYKVRELSRNDRKKIDYLRRRGFSWDQISRLIND